MLSLELSLLGEKVLLDIKGMKYEKNMFFMRILRSLVSIFLVTTLTYMIIYTLTPRNLIFKNDPNYNK